MTSALVLLLAGAAAPGIAPLPIEVDEIALQARTYLLCVRSFDHRQFEAQRRANRAIEMEQNGRGDLAEAIEELRAASDQVKALRQKMNLACDSAKSQFVGKLKRRLRELNGTYSDDQVDDAASGLLWHLQAASALLAMFRSGDYKVPPKVMQFAVPPPPSGKAAGQ